MPFLVSDDVQPCAPDLAPQVSRLGPPKPGTGQSLWGQMRYCQLSASSESTVPVAKGLQLAEVGGGPQAVKMAAVQERMVDEALEERFSEAGISEGAGP